LKGDVKEDAMFNVEILYGEDLDSLLIEVSWLTTVIEDIRLKCDAGIIFVASE